MFLFLITGTLLVVDHFFASQLGLHASFQIMVLFFGIQTFVLFRLDHFLPEELSAQGSLIKITLRMLLSMTLIAVLVYTQEDRFALVVQFVSLYLLFMIFEIVTALTNLRRN